MYDQTEAEIARREHDAEMGSQTTTDRQWSRWFDRAAAAVKANGWETPLTKGLDGAQDEDGFSIDYAYDAFERGETVETYIAEAARRRKEMGV
jgi:hypothetical protein